MHRWVIGTSPGFGRVVRSFRPADLLGDRGLGDLAGARRGASRSRGPGALTLAGRWWCAGLSTRTLLTRTSPGGRAAGRRSARHTAVARGGRRAAV